MAKPKKKPLPHRTYPRGHQGTFVYSPDVSVYIMTENYGIIDLGPHITSFTLQRNVNGPSSFTCTFDNKFARFDRVIRRMDRIVVFLKRVRWMQEFAGYVSTAPWQTIVPGDAMLQADCTLKRLAYTFWDAHSAEAQELYPPKAGINTTADGGAGVTMFKLLTAIADWDESQIHIQKIPQKWLARATEALTKSQEEYQFDDNYQRIMNALMGLLDADGWRGYLAKQRISALTGDQAKWVATLGTGQLTYTGVDDQWQKKYGKNKREVYPEGSGTRPPRYSGFVPLSALADSGTYDIDGHKIFLRPDAAMSLNKLRQNVLSSARGRGGYRIQNWYVGYGPEQRLPGQPYDQMTTIRHLMQNSNNQTLVVCTRVKCPAGADDHGWGTAIDFDPENGSPPESVMNQYGWIQDPTGHGAQSNTNHWIFVGNYAKGYPAYITPSQNPARNHTRKSTPDNQFNWNEYNANQQTAESSPFDTTQAFKARGFDLWDSNSMAFTGKLAPINDIPLLQSVADFAGASMRDFQSGPNGDFISFFPDRLGVYGKFASVKVRNIEVIDFKLIITDHTLVTHLFSVGDFQNPLENTLAPLGELVNTGIVSVEQPEVMQLLLGLPPDEVPDGLGAGIMERFGIRPRRDDNYNIQNLGMNYMLALHRFQEAWAQQWQALVTFTFLPEVYPGMRIELADFGLGVYVENVVHNGSRTSGFQTQATVSTPMSKVNGKWRLLQMEFNPEDYNISPESMPAEPPSYWDIKHGDMV